MVDRDIERLREHLTTLLNLEMAATEEMIGIAERVRPDCITLVPERREERTTEGGLDVVALRSSVGKVTERARARGIKVSYFIAPCIEQVRASRELGAEQIELHTGEYCHAKGSAQADELKRLHDAAAEAASLGLEVAAGHGLTRQNVFPVAAIPSVKELNIGHAVISDALFMGLGPAVRAMREALGPNAWK